MVPLFDTALPMYRLAFKKKKNISRKINETCFNNEDFCDYCVLKLWTRKKGRYFT